jgi:hypothetical protein
VGELLVIDPKPILEAIEEMGDGSGSDLDTELA